MSWFSSLVASSQLAASKALPAVLLLVLRPGLQQQRLTVTLLTALRNLKAAAGAVE